MTTHGHITADELQRALLEIKEARAEVQRFEELKRITSGPAYVRAWVMHEEWSRRKNEREERFVQLSLAASKDW